MKRVRAQVRAVLNTSWDPIGVAHAVEDEYDGYIDAIYSMLRGGASDADLAAHLLRIETDRMGLRGTSDARRLAVAARLRALRLPSV